MINILFPFATNQFDRLYNLEKNAWCSKGWLFLLVEVDILCAGAVATYNY